MRSPNFKTGYAVQIVFETEEQARECYQKINKVREHFTKTKGTAPLYNSLLVSSLVPAVEITSERIERL